MSHTLLFMVTVVLMVTSTAACHTDADCSYLGVCNAILAECRCDPGWKNPDCAAADLLPYNVSSHLGYVNDTQASWGGHPLPDPKVPNRWHLLVSEIANGCPLWLFMNNSQIVRAVSASEDLLSPKKG